MLAPRPSPRPPRRPRRPAAHLRAVLPCALALLLLGATLPSQVLPGEAEGDRVALVPAAVRAPEGTTTVDLVVGAAAPGDVVVALSLAAAVPGPGGEVTPGGSVPGATVTRGSRVRPGERLRATVTTDVPALLVADVTPVGDRTVRDEDPAAAEATSLSTLVLPGTAGPAPELVLSTEDGATTGRVTVTAPLLVSVRLDAATSTVLADRLVLPDRPLDVTDDRATWLRPTELVVTDELGRTVRATRGTGGLVALAGGLLLLAVAAVVVMRRRG